MGGPHKAVPLGLGAVYGNAVSEFSLVSLLGLTMTLVHIFVEQAGGPDGYGKHGYAYNQPRRQEQRDREEEGRSAILFSLYKLSIG